MGGSEGTKNLRVSIKDGQKRDVSRVKEIWKEGLVA